MRKLLLLITLLTMVLGGSTLASLAEPAQPAGQEPLANTILPPTYLPVVGATEVIVNINGITATPASPAGVTVNVPHHINVTVDIKTTHRGPLAVTLLLGNTVLDSDCLMVNKVGVSTQSFGLDAPAVGTTGIKDYTIEARFKPGALTCQDNGPYTHEVATIPYRIDWQSSSPCSGAVIPSLMQNGSFESGWTDYNGSIQLANSWNISWKAPGEALYRNTENTASGEPEFTHKENTQFPPQERLCTPGALILDGFHVYKIFHNGRIFGAELQQTVGGLTPGTRVRLTVPMLLIQYTQDNWGQSGGVWLDGNGGWLWSHELGNRVWHKHIHEAIVPASGQVTILIRMESRFEGADFFLDAIKLEQVP